jgi:hypothetical protein
MGDGAYLASLPGNMRLDNISGSEAIPFIPNQEKESRYSNRVKPRPAYLNNGASFLNSGTAESSIIINAILSVG